VDTLFIFFVFILGGKHLSNQICKLANAKHFHEREHVTGILMTSIIAIEPNNFCAKELRSKTVVFVLNL